MKVVGVISSPSRDGNTAVLVREALAAAAEQGAEIEEIFLPDHRLEFCLGCFACLASGRCAIPDDLEALKARLRQADGIILGSPTHALEPNALMKNFLDRVGLFNAYTSALKDKCVAGIATAGAAGAGAAAKRMTALNGGFFGQGRVSGVLGASHGWERIERFPKALARARRLGARMVDDLRRGRKNPPWYRLTDNLITSLVLRPIMRKNILANKDGRMKAVYQSLVDRGWLA